MIMNSVLTMEERTLLDSLGNPDKANAVRVLDELVMALPLGSELFFMVFGLKRKLESEAVDLRFDSRDGALEIEQ